MNMLLVYLEILKKNKNCFPCHLIELANIVDSFKE